jgi:predicted small metal-binding protein
MFYDHDEGLDERQSTLAPAHGMTEWLHHCRCWPITPLWGEEIMSPEDSFIHQQSCSFETALRQLLHTAQTTDSDPQGTYTVPAPDKERPAYTVEITTTTADERRPRRGQHSYCLHCDWTVSTAELPRDEVSRQIVRHAVETGHDINSVRQCESDEDRQHCPPRFG